MDLLKKIIFLSFSLFILILFIWALYLPKKDVTQTLSTVIQEQKERFDLYYKGVTLSETSNGVKYWEIRAATSSVNKSTNIASMENTEGTFFEKNSPVLKFTAPSAKWRMDTKEITLYKPVGYDAKAEKNNLLSIFARPKPNYFQFPAYGEKGSGFFFQSEKLLWSMKDKKIICNEGLWIQKGKVSGLAQNLQADVAMEKVKLYGKPRVNIADTITTVIEAKEFLIDNTNDIITANDNVKIKADDIIVTASNGEYDQANNLLTLKGTVEAKYKDFKARSDNAMYNINAKKLVLSKNARLLRNQSSLTGEKVIIDTTTKHVSITGQSKIVIPEEEITQESK